MEDHSHAATATVYYFPLGGEPLSFFLWASALKRLVGSPYEMWRRRIMVDPASCIIELTIFLTATRKRQTTDMSAGLERTTVYVRRTLSFVFLDGWSDMRSTYRRARFRRDVSLSTPGVCRRYCEELSAVTSVTRTWHRMACDH